MAGASWRPIPHTPKATRHGARTEKKLPDALAETLTSFASPQPVRLMFQDEARLEKRTRRRFSAAEKRRLVTAADALPHGDKGAWRRRNGLYAAQWSAWRKQYAGHGLEGLRPQSPGRKAADPGGAPDGPFAA